MTAARVGQRLPPVTLARAGDGGLQVEPLEPMLQGRQVILVGLPGAFTPVCTGRHLPDLIRNAARLKASGINEIICVAPDNPWAVYEWSRRVDEHGQLTFLSDGNLELARAAGLTTHEPRYFLGECSKRFTMVLRNAVIEKMAVEARIDMVSCTSPAQLLD